jgi:hypothetical protein
MNQIGIRFTVLAILVVAASMVRTATVAAKPRPAISEDRELKEIDLKSWDCRDQAGGTAKTPDGAERNQLKNRPVIDLSRFNAKSMETAAFLQKVAAFDAQTKGTRRKDIGGSQKRDLDALESQLVSFTAYLVIAYAGPPESTNCGSSDFHDWHLELFEKPLDHAPGIGDPTPIICEITPRTQNAVFASKTRLQNLAGFIRAPDLSAEPTGHAARKVRVTGYLLWDDEHNGTADIGSTIQTIAGNGFHQPWRSTAWEIHPAIRLEALDATTVPPAPNAASTPAPSLPAPSAQSAPTLPPAAPPQTKLVTLTMQVRIKIPYGETVLPPGTKLPMVSHDATTVTVSYIGGTYAIPISATDFR